MRGEGDFYYQERGGGGRDAEAAEGFSDLARLALGAHVDGGMAIREEMEISGGWGTHVVIGTQRKHNLRMHIPAPQPVLQHVVHRPVRSC